jgi:hypothetical protein
MFLGILHGMGAAVFLPKAMAYATVAGLPVVVGLYTAFVPMIVYALLGSSRITLAVAAATLIVLPKQSARPRVSVIGRKCGSDVLPPLSPDHPDDETLRWLVGLNPGVLDIVRYAGLDRHEQLHH